MLPIIAGVGIAVLAVVYFAIRFWLVSTRPANIRDVPTPKLDELNRAALEQMGDEEEGSDEEDEAPDGLKAVMPEQDPGKRGA